MTQFSTEWRPALFKRQQVFVLCDEAGAAVFDRGRVPMKYRVSDERVYLASPGNVCDLQGQPLRQSSTPAPSRGTTSNEIARAVPAIGSSRQARAAQGAPTAQSSRPKEGAAGGALVIYTDGACFGNPGPAALGVVIEDGKTRTEIGEYLGRGTNNIAELNAVLRGLESVSDPARPTVLYTDSQYAIGVLTKGWKAKANVALIARIKELIKAFSRLQLRYVPGHSGIPGNERADALAREAIARKGDIRVENR